jgi:hypothetical protein
MSACHSFSVEFYHSAWDDLTEVSAEHPGLVGLPMDDGSTRWVPPFTLTQAVLAMDAEDLDALQNEDCHLWPGCDAEDVVAQAIRVDAVDGYRTPVSVYLDEEGYYSVDVYERPRDVPEFPR